MIDIFFIDDKFQTSDGVMLPDCWTTELNDGLDENGELINPRIEPLPEWQGLFCPPVIGTAGPGEYVFHLMGSTQQAALLETLQIDTAGIAEQHVRTELNVGRSESRHRQQRCHDSGNQGSASRKGVLGMTVHVELPWA